MTLPESQKPLKRMKEVDSKIEYQYNIMRIQMRNVNDKREVLKRMRDLIKKLNDTMIVQQRIDLETQLLNDYNYLISKTR
jgi:glutamine amidotransferase-like uncharacterized protein